MSASALPAGFVSRLDLSRAATPRLVREHPVHRWFDFPHSYSPELVSAILDEWALPSGAAILDPFVGAGTTLLVAKARGYAALGTDLSAVALLASAVKVADHDPGQVLEALSAVMAAWDRRSHSDISLPNVHSIPDRCQQESWRLQKAFLPSEMAILWALRADIMGLPTEVRGFFLLALMRIVPRFSRAVADGGWFRWAERPDQSAEILPVFLEQVRTMVKDIREHQDTRSAGQAPACDVQLLDARNLDALEPRRFDALVTSPPYPNRHDYSRVFHVQLLLLGESEDSVLALRRGSLRSHVEARPPDGLSTSQVAGYEPAIAAKYLSSLPGAVDGRVRRFLAGYFEDLYLVLRGAQRVLKPGARLAFVVGNVRHGGVLFPVDEILASIASRMGYNHVSSWLVRLRGNSAQQMGRYGRMPSRESVVFLRHPPTTVGERAGG